MHNAELKFKKIKFKSYIFLFKFKIILLKNGGFYKTYTDITINIYEEKTVYFAIAFKRKNS